MPLSAISAAIELGASVRGAENGFLGLSHSVKYLVEITNFTDQVLVMARSEVHSGYFNEPPPPEIMPGRKESYNGVKGEGATGAIAAIGLA